MPETQHSSSSASSISGDEPLESSEQDSSRLVLSVHDLSADDIAKDAVRRAEPERRGMLKHTGTPMPPQLLELLSEDRGPYVNLLTNGDPKTVF